MQTQPPGRFSGLDAARVADEGRHLAGELRRKLASDLRTSFARLLREHYDQDAAPDPVLATLFLAIGDQLAPVYETAEEHLPAAVLDELVRGLEMPGRLATPAQTVAQFSVHTRAERISRLAQVSGRTPTGTRVKFAPVAPIVASPARLRFAGAYEPREGGGRLYALSGAEIERGVPVPLGQTPLELERTPPTLYLAFSVEDAPHLGGLGLFVDTVRPDSRVARALQASPWQLLATRDGHAVALDRHMLRCGGGTGGVQELAWVVPPGGAAPGEPEEDGAALPVFTGYYGPMVWVFPPVPEDRRVTTTTPASIGAAVRELLPEGFRDALDEPCVWVRVPLGPEGAGAAAAIHRVVPHCVPLANVEVWNGERVTFEETGSVVSLLPEGNPNRHIVGVLDVVGERGTRYEDAGQLAEDPDAGRYRIRGPQIELVAARGGEEADRYARVRLLLSDGPRANEVAADDPLRRESAFDDPTLVITNLTPSRGGKGPPGFEEARTRFAERLRTRDRVVTAADIGIAARAFDPRIQSATVEGVQAERVPGRGLRPVTRVLATVEARQFDDPDVELPLLEAQLAAHLQRRALLGQTIRVQTVVHG